MNNQDLGNIGESLAASYLKKNGHEILKRNYRLRHAEVDIISLFEDKIHFTEVKTRQTALIGEPWRAVTRKKQRQIVKVADHYLKEGQIDKHAQFNIVSIVYNSFRSDLEYIPGAFVA
jgi:putative endonuclease